MLIYKLQDHDACITHKKVNCLIFHTGFYLIFILFNYLVILL